jgi:hypothetical protein
MEHAHEDGYVVFVRAASRPGEDPEFAERPVVSCPTYEEAHRVKNAWHQAGRECVIRYLGEAGGGD